MVTTIKYKQRMLLKIRKSGHLSSVFRLKKSKMDQDGANMVHCSNISSDEAETECICYCASNVLVEWGRIDRFIYGIYIF